MDLASVPIDIWISQGVFALLFIWLFMDSRKEAKQREDKLMNHLAKTTVTLDVLSSRMENVNTKVESIDTRLTVFEREER
ncbi:BhlA/UviB family holin-like peptide [Oceanobacillus sp. CAU 1775]